MVGGLLAIFILVWTYWKAVKWGLSDPAKWALHAVAIYFLVVFGWWWFANLTAVEPYHHKSLMAGIFFAYFGHILGLATVALLHRFWFQGGGA